MKRLLFALGVAAVAVVIDFVEAPRIWAQVSAPAFEVASVKLTDSRTGYIRSEPGRLTARGRTLASLSLRAYSLQDYQLTHAPAGASPLSPHPFSAGRITPPLRSGQLPLD